MTLYVNAVKYFEVTGLPPDKQLPDKFIKGPVYVYNASTIYKPFMDTIGPYPATRFHWNHFAVNPGPATATPLFCGDQPRGICAALRNLGGTPAVQTVARQSPSPNTGGVNFNDLEEPGRPLTGQYPAGTIDWGSGAWYLSGPYDEMQTNSVSFNGEGPTSASFSFVSPHQLVQLDADNGANTSGTVTLACDGQPSKSVDIDAHQLVTIQTGWSGPCTTVTVTSSNGWDTNFTSLVIN
jgi:hypothetical protein